MRMLASGVVLGVALGAFVGRSWRPLLDADIKLIPVLVGSLVLRVIAPLAAAAAYPLYLSALALTAAAAVANVRLKGAIFVATGGVLNLLVVLANGGMPVDPAAVAAAGTRMPSDPLHVALTDASLLRPLADVIPLGIVHNVYSVGDFFIGAGGFLVPFMLLSRK